MILWLKTYIGDHAHAASNALPKYALQRMAKEGAKLVVCLCGKRLENAKPAPNAKRCPTCERKAKKMESEGKGRNR